MQYFILFSSGASLTLAYSPFDFWPITFFALAILFRTIVRASSARSAAKAGFVFGLGWFAVGISWVHIAIADFGGLPLILSLLLMLLLVSYLAIYPALCGYLTYKWQTKLGVFALIPAWMITEWLRSWMLTGFPWLSVGYSQLYSPLSAFAPVIGEFGLQLLVVTLAVCTLCLRKTALSALTTLAIACVFLNQLTWYQKSSDKINIALVQGNIEQSVKWQPENELPTMKKYFELTLPHLESADLIVWPEAAIPKLEILANDFLVDLDRIANENNTALITGIVDYQPDTNLAFNNLVVLGNKQGDDTYGHYKYLDNNRYSKHHLLPIGEFVPFESVLRHLAPIFNLPMSSFSRGSYVQENLIANGLNINSAICFEIAFASQVKANLYHDSDMILTVSNDAWFGDSHGPWQHLQIAQMRALEFAKPVIRVTNNGITAVIDETGNITNMLAQNEAAVLTQELTMSQANTFYSHWGNIPVWFSLFISSLLAMLQQRRSQAKNIR